jgi:hypothetical protein
LALVGQDRAAHADLVRVDLDDPHPECGLGRAGGRRGGSGHLGDERALSGGVVSLAMVIWINGMAALPSIRCGVGGR